LEKLVNEQPELAQSDRGRVAWKGDALHTVLGDEKPGQVHGMGLLPVPNQVYGRIPRYLKNINMSTTNDSPHDRETDVMEEIAMLKRRIEEQDQRIEEQDQRIEERDQIIEGFKNQSEVCGINEMQMIRFLHSYKYCTDTLVFSAGQFPNN
jgi:hypothetical protein